jgi:hypothetical protein
MIQGNILYDPDEQALDHTFSNVMKMDTPTIEKIRLWMDYTNTKPTSYLSDLNFAESPNLIPLEYIIFQTKYYLGRITCLQLGLIMRMSQFFMAEHKRFPTNDNWISYIKRDYDEFRTSGRALIPPDSPFISSPV